MSTCVKCKYEVPAGQRFCGNCGQEQTGSHTQLFQQDRSTLVGWLVPTVLPHLAIKVMGQSNDIGRESSCSVNLRQEISHEHINTVSGKHASMELDNGIVSLIDLKSRNKTFINGEEIKPNVIYTLPDQCLLRFGMLECIFKRYRS